jgi:hypothetical protein
MNSQLISVCVTVTPNVTKFEPFSSIWNDNYEEDNIWEVSNFNSNYICCNGNESHYYNMSNKLWEKNIIRDGECCSMCYDDDMQRDYEQYED